MSFRNPSAGSWSASTSPARSPSPSRFGHHHSATHHGTSSSHTGGSGGGAHHQQSYGGRSRGVPSNAAMYGTTSLCQRSRSPSPARLQEMRERNNRFDHDEMGTSQNSLSSLRLLLLSFLPIFPLSLSMFCWQLLGFCPLLFSWHPQLILLSATMAINQLFIFTSPWLLLYSLIIV